MSWTITGTQKVPPTVWDPNFLNVSLLLHGDGTNGSTTIVDSSPTPKTVTAFGNAQIDTTVTDPFSRTGVGVIQFNGNGDYLQTSSSSTLSAWSTDFTIEGWFFANVLGNINFCCTNSTINSDALTGMYVYQNGQIAIGRLGLNELASAAGVFTSNAWTHIAWVGSGNTVSIYANGILVASGNTTYLETTTTKPLTIGGSFQSADPGYWNGYIDDFRVTKGVARYTSNFTPPTAPFPDI